MITDGSYPAFIIDAEDGRADDGTELLHLSVTILTGEHKGEVVELSAVGLGLTIIDVIGMPATLTVVDGAPSLTIDDA
jgi:hypothetical protein